MLLIILCGIKIRRNEKYLYKRVRSEKSLVFVDKKARLCILFLYSLFVGVLLEPPKRYIVMGRECGRLFGVIVSITNIPAIMPFLLRAGFAVDC